MTPSPIQWRILTVAAVGLAASVLGLVLDPKTMLSSYLAAWFAVSAIPLGALAVLLTSYLARAGWTRDLQVPLSGIVLTLPALAVMFLPVLIGMREIYPWVADTSALPAFKAVYLTPSLFLLRALIYFVAWTAIAIWSVRAYGDDAAMTRAGAAGLIVWALTVSFAGVDWLESVEPEFHSSIYGLLAVGFTLLAGIATALIAAIGVKRTQTMRNSAYAGVFLSVLLLWAYLHAMQYIIIWTGNLPDETVWYLKRLEGGWAFALWGLFVAQFIVPFFILLSEKARQSTRVLLWLAGATLALHYVEAVVLVLPPLNVNGTMLLLDLPAALLLAGGGWLYALTVAAGYVGRIASRRPAAAH
jgi:hypothetical protein